MSNLTPATSDTLSAGERAAIEEAFPQFRALRPAMIVNQRPMRDQSGKLAEVHYIRAAPPHDIVGRARMQPNGRFIVEV